jgi:hypothetical protein
MNGNDYIVHRIPKRDGSMRILHEPKPALKLKQKQIQRYLQARGLKGSYCAHGFIPGRSAVTHAKNHLRKRVIVKCDIEDFFGSTTGSMVAKALTNCNLNKETVNDICEICLLNNALPQGAPSSSLLSNLAFMDLDKRLAGLAKKFKATYSRYAVSEAVMTATQCDPAAGKIRRGELRLQAEGQQEQSPPAQPQPDCHRRGGQPEAQCPARTQAQYPRPAVQAEKSAAVWLAVR